MIFSLTTAQIIFLALLGALGAQRVGELLYSKRNERRILAAGGREVAPGHFRLMQAVHIFWFPAMIAEVLYLERTFHPALFAGALVLIAAGQALRYAAILHLGERWTVRIFVLPGVPARQSGLYRFIRHPNYLGVVLEFAAVPLLHSAWLVAVCFSLANGLVLWIRIRAEEQALRATAGAEYETRFGKLGRFVPN